MKQNLRSSHANTATIILEEDRRTTDKNTHKLVVVILYDTPIRIYKKHGMKHLEFSSTLSKHQLGKQRRRKGTAMGIHNTPRHSCAIFSCCEETGSLPFPV